MHIATTRGPKTVSKIFPIAYPGVYAIAKILESYSSTTPLSAAVHVPAPHRAPMISTASNFNTNLPK